MTDQELKDLVASLAISQHDLTQKMAETDRKMAETNQKMAETDRFITRIGKQIGELGNKFGSFAEGMVLPSMEKVLRKQFGMTDVSARRKFFLKGETLEMDVFGYDNTGEIKEAYVVEIKSHLKSEAIGQILDTISKLPRFFPEMKDRKIYGILASVDIPDNIRGEVVKSGLYLARISDETFKLIVPAKFKPTDFGPLAQQNSDSNGHTNGRSKKKKSHKNTP